MENLTIRRILAISVGVLLLINIGKWGWKKAHPEYKNFFYTSSEDTHIDWEEFYMELKKACKVPKDEEMYMTRYPITEFVAVEGYYGGMSISGIRSHSYNDIDPVVSSIVNHRQFILRENKSGSREVRISMNMSINNGYGYVNICVAKGFKDVEILDYNLVEKNCMSGKEFFKMMNMIDPQFFRGKVEDDIKIGLEDKIVTKDLWKSIAADFEQMNPQDNVDIYMVKEGEISEIDQEAPEDGVYLAIKFKMSNFVMLYRWK